MSQLQYWVWLSMRFGVRPKMKLALVEHFGTPRDVYFATEADYRVRVPLRPEELRLLLDKDLKEANRALAICDREHIRIPTIQDAAYPQRLLQIYDPPLVLYVRARCRSSMTVRPSPWWAHAAQHRMVCALRKFGSEIVRSRRHCALRPYRRDRSLGCRGRTARRWYLRWCIRYGGQSGFAGVCTQEVALRRRRE